MNKKGLKVILSAPSGCGKDTVYKELQKIRDDVAVSVSATTREPRKGEKEGVDYFFKTKKEFEEMIKNDELLEYASYNNCYYGTPVFGVNKVINEGKICFLIIEVKGAKKVMELFPDAVSIFLVPPSMEALEKRLRKRATDTEEMIEKRLEIAKEEIKESNSYKYQVTNGNLDVAVENINKIICDELSSRNV